MSTITAGGSPAAGTPQGVAPARGPGSLERQNPRRGEKLVMMILRGAAILSVLVTVGIVVSLLLPALSFFRDYAGR